MHKTDLVRHDNLHVIVMIEYKNNLQQQNNNVNYKVMLIFQELQWINSIEISAVK